MIVKVRCPNCHGELDLTKEFDESEWTEVKVDKVEDTYGLYCSKCRRESENEAN